MRVLKRISLVLLAVLLTLAIMVAALYGIEDWRGARAWARAQCKLAARGESLNAADFIPPPVPDEQNLAMIPLFAKALNYGVDPVTKALTFGPRVQADTPFSEMPYGKKGTKPKGATFGGWMSGHAFSLPSLREYYAKLKDFPHPAQPGKPSDDILLALTKFAPALDEIEQAIAARPQARFPVNWTFMPALGIQLPHYNTIQQTTGVLRLRALVDLDAGRGAEAARDVASAFRLRAAIQPEPTLIGHLVIIACDGLVLQPVWEGLAARRWTADELREIQTGLRADDLLADYARANRGERALFICRTLDQSRKSGSIRQAFGLPNDDSEEAWGYRALDLSPRGWIDQNEASTCLGYQRLITGIVDLKTRRVSPEGIKAMADERAQTARLFSPYTVLMKLILPIYDSVLAKTARMQTACEQAETACALERYFLDHKTYPETLDALVPALLDRVPTDLIDGVPMRYRRTDDGRYCLYGIGWNGRDDGATIAWKGGSGADNPFTPDDKQGDWVWQYTPVDPPGGKP